MHTANYQRIIDAQIRLGEIQASIETLLDMEPGRLGWTFYYEEYTPFFLAQISDANLDKITAFHEGLVAEAEKKKLYVEETTASAAERDRRFEGLRSELARRGWYITPSINIRMFENMADIVAEGRNDDLDQIVVEFAESRVASVRDDAENLWEERRPILRDALDAHYEGRYTLSVPVLLAQADGISAALLKHSMFSKQHGTPKTKETAVELVDAIAGTDINAHVERASLQLVLDPFRRLHSTAFKVEDWQQARAKDPHVGSLNRHAVVHGLDVAYATCENSLRCILALDALSYVEHRVR